MRRSPRRHVRRTPGRGGSPGRGRHLRLPASAEDLSSVTSAARDVGDRAAHGLRLDPGSRATDAERCRRPSHRRHCVRRWWLAPDRRQLASRPPKRSCGSTSSASRRTDPDGAELDRVAGTNNYGRTVLRQWCNEGRIPTRRGGPADTGRWDDRPPSTSSSRRRRSRPLSDCVWTTARTGPQTATRAPVE